MTADQDDVWALYAKGVKKIGAEKNEREPQIKKKTESHSTSLPTEPKTGTRERYAGAMPDAWQKLIEKEAPALKEEEVKSLLEEKKAAPPMARARLPEPLDVRVERNLSLGDVFIEGKLDLHGNTEAKAHEKLLGFIEDSLKRKRRLVLVITGRGKDGSSVLKQNLPRWCGVPPLDSLIRAIRMAAPDHGGDGAYYILLHKR